MSMIEALEDLAKEMEEEAEEMKRGSAVGMAYEDVSSLLRRYSRGLRRIIKSGARGIAHHPETPPPSHQELIMREREKIQRERQIAEQNQIDRSTGGMGVCQDGPEEGTMAPIPEGTQLGARTYVGSSIYQLAQGNQLVYVPPESKIATA